MKQVVQAVPQTEIIVAPQRRAPHLRLVDAADAVWVISRQQPKSRLTSISIAYAVAVMIVWILETFVAERTLFTTMLTYTVQALFLVPCGLLLVVAAIKRNRRAASFSVLSAALVVLLLMRPTVSFAANPPNGTALRVMQYNVNKWNKGPEAVAASIRKVNPDVVCLEEADDYWYSPAGATLMPKLLPKYHWVHQGEMVVGSKYRIVSAHAQPLTVGDNYRSISAVDIATKRGIVTVFATHFKDIKWKKPRTWSGVAANRLAEVATMRSMVIKTKYPWIIAGDLNLQPSGFAYQRLAALGTDAFDAAGHGFGYTARTAIPCARIDHIFVSKRITPNRTWNPLLFSSDHLPLVSDVIVE
ncbi:MAG TPA: endonuclease/exonuclease/phosphatase family protein [Capsulimonadaceae bacterium]